METVYQIALIVHIFSAIVLVGSMFFNVFILGPALRRVPPAHSAVVGDKVAKGLEIAGPASLLLLGVTGFLRLEYMGLFSRFFTPGFLSSHVGARLGGMFVCWAVLVVTGTVSAVWYSKVLAKKLPYAAGLRELEDRRAVQERISRWQDRLNYVNVTLGFLAALGGSLYESGL